MTFDKPTDTWIEEDVEVPVLTPKINEAEGRVEITQEKKIFKQKTMYVDSKPTRVICSSHEYMCLDKGKYLFKCKKCDWHRFAFPVSYKFDPATGILTNRVTGIRA